VEGNWHGVSGNENVVESENFCNYHSHKLVTNSNLHLVSMVDTNRSQNHIRTRTKIYRLINYTFFTRKLET
jgi:hypothetical protein